MINSLCLKLNSRSCIATLEFDPQGELAVAVAGILCGLRSTQDAEGCVIDLCGGRSEVGVVEYVGKCGLKAHSYSLGDVEAFGKTEAGCCGCAWSIEDADSALPKRPAPAGVGANAARLK